MTDGRTDGQTDRQTDGLTDISYANDDDDGDENDDDDHDAAAAPSPPPMLLLMMMMMFNDRYVQKTTRPHLYLNHFRAQLRYNVLTKVTSIVLTRFYYNSHVRKSASPPGGYVLPRSGTIFELS
ncbi:hypothetical protein DPMN_017264 [Dreissena polymorpha]|uniref:Uncharacterized protein n=1 Tax=Dreissena polymorpha TaxID=45954 RepID=A0A9D4NCV3_DREPO|nr:hypothetical protein DPMN_017264 [Dreissena polymorpha]